MKKIFSLFGLTLILFLASCQKEEINKPLTKDELITKVTKILKGDIILGQDVKMSNVSKTLLPGGCPTKFSFTWLEKEKKLQIFINKIKPGKMPFAISMTASSELMELNIWEKDEYKGDGWIKFFDDKAETTPYQEGYDKPLPKPQGSTIVKGYFNVNTQEIELLINYNMMNVTGHIFKQKIDKNRTDFEKELSLFEEKLSAYKLDHELSNFIDDSNKKAIDLLKKPQQIGSYFTLDKKKAKKTDTLTFSFKWNDMKANDVKGRMKIELPKTKVNDNTMQLSITGEARWLDMLTGVEEKKYIIEGTPFAYSDSNYRKMIGYGIKATLWSADGKTQIKTSDKGVLRMIVFIPTKEITLSLTDPELKLDITAPVQNLKD